MEIPRHYKNNSLGKSWAYGLYCQGSHSEITFLPLQHEIPIVLKIMEMPLLILLREGFQPCLLKALVQKSIYKVTLLTASLQSLQTGGKCLALTSPAAPQASIWSSWATDINENKKSQHSIKKVVLLPVKWVVFSFHMRWWAKVRPLTTCVTTPEFFQVFSNALANLKH